MLFNNRNTTKRSSKPDFQSRKHYIFEVPFDQLTDDSIVCTCAQIKYSDVKQCIEFGITSVDGILEDLGAGDSCRKCVSYLEMLVDHARTEMGL